MFSLPRDLCLRLGRDLGPTDWLCLTATCKALWKLRRTSRLWKWWLAELGHRCAADDMMEEFMTRVRLDRAWRYKLYSFRKLTLGECVGDNDERLYRRCRNEHTILDFAWDRTQGILAVAHMGSVTCYHWSEVWEQPHLMWHHSTSKQSGLQETLEEAHIGWLGGHIFCVSTKSFWVFDAQGSIKLEDWKAAPHCSLAIGATSAAVCRGQHVALVDSRTLQVTAQWQLGDAFDADDILVNVFFDDAGKLWYSTPSLYLLEEDGGFTCVLDVPPSSYGGKHNIARYGPMLCIAARYMELLIIELPSSTSQLPKIAEKLGGVELQVLSLLACVCTC